MLEQEKQQLLAKVQDSPVAILLLEECKKIYEDETQEAVRHPRICDDDICRDLRYHLGIAEGMRRILNKVKEARELAKNQ